MFYSSLSKCANLVKTTCLLVSSISPAKNTSSSIAYTFALSASQILHYAFSDPQKAQPISTYLVEIKHQVQLANVTKERIEHFHEEMYSLQICQLVVIRVDAGAEE